jgi:hypothetical protein
MVMARPTVTGVATVTGDDAFIGGKSWSRYEKN